MGRLFQKIISPSLSPNTEAEDVQEAIRVLIHPSTWKQGSAIVEVEQWFTTFLNASTVVSFDSGRSALLAILRAFCIGNDDEVLVQAFTCVAVPNSVRWAGATPVYVDIDDRFNVDPEDLEKKITKRSKAIVVQHTFGVPAQMDKILAVAKKHRLLVIEDCAHSLGATYGGKRVGTLGDAAFFSFGRDKVISSVWGGMATISQKSKVKSQKLRELQEELSFPSRAWIAQQLFHPIAFAVILPTYNIFIGKMLLEAFKKLQLLSVPVYKEEKRGGQPSEFPRRYPNALAKLLVVQLTKLNRYNDQRRRIARYYYEVLKRRKDITVPVWNEEGLWLRFPILVDNPSDTMRRGKDNGILLGNWYHHVVDPIGVDVRAVGYTRGSCPGAEKTAARIINLPTRVTEECAGRVVAIL
ncbi:aminotransferase class I/II-fold pyridoxal phosphate-dependent enzyme [Candidatus Gottesmanbacteria bacterium]|nr:aminotransferase class I/II-fold pyridoxal phosphate-dependent enzyme [Candidatus Gottesmanbacteria bacterium]